MYPDPLDCTKYYLRIYNTFYNFTCPNNLIYDQYEENCIQNMACKQPNITPLFSNNCNQGMPGYYCESPYSFTYCTHDNMKIIKNNLCPDTRFCKGPPYTNPCVP